MKKSVLPFLFALAMSTIGAQTISTISVVSDEWEDCTAKDGSGLYFDVIRQVYAGSKLDIRIVPFARSVQMVESKRADLSVGNYVGDVEKGLYPMYPIDYDDVTVLMTKATGASFAGESSLKGKKVAWITDYGYENHIKVPMTFVEVSDRESGINMLKAGRVDYYVETSEEILGALEGLKLSEDDFKLEPIKYLSLYVCFADNDKGKRLQAMWDKRIPELIASGALEKIYAKWDFSDSYQRLKKAR